jgi:hypothetical protein
MGLRNGSAGPGTFTIFKRADAVYEGVGTDAEHRLHTSSSAN